MNKSESSNPKNIITRNNASLSTLIKKAKDSSRKRVLDCMHVSLDSKLHSMINVISKGSYVTPHKHWIETKNKVINKGESFLTLRGEGKLLFFNDAGEMIKIIRLNEKEQTMVWIPENIWHSLIATSEYLITFENKTGPWEEGKDKIFHPSFPEEGKKDTDKIVREWEAL